MKPPTTAPTMPKMTVRHAVRRAKDPIGYPTGDRSDDQPRDDTHGILSPSLHRAGVLDFPPRMDRTTEVNARAVRTFAYPTPPP
jgi:hypothetical protein